MIRTKTMDNLDSVLYSADEVQLDRELCKRSLYEFMQLAWDVIEPARGFTEGWHIEAICEHLEAVFRGEIKRLVINVPPGSTKSLSCGVFFPAWVWSQNPGKKFIFGSYSDRVSYRDGRRTLRLIQSEWYQERWGTVYEIGKGEKSVVKLENDKGGFRMSTTVGGAVTGEHADIQVVDDPHKPLEVTGSMHVAKNALDRVQHWWDETMSSRMVSLDESARIIIMQRLHAADLAGVAVNRDGYDHLMLPMRFEPTRRCTTGIGFTDPRTEPEELLCPERFPLRAVETLTKELGPRGAAAQLQQNPIPAEGSILKEAYMQYYNVRPSRFQLQIQSWDCTFKEDGTSYVVGTVWGSIDEQYYLLDRFRERVGFVDTCKAIEAMTAKWPRAQYKLVEAKANGNAVVDALRKRISGFKLVEPEGGKIARTHAIEPLFESGAVFLPCPDLAPWIGEFVAELTGFPSMEYDDQVDSTTQALVFLQTKRLGRFREAMRKA